MGLTLALLAACGNAHPALPSSTAINPGLAPTAVSAFPLDGTERCPMPPHVTVPPTGVALGDARRAFCVVWATEYGDARAFRVSVRYEGGERFTHTVGAGEHDFIFPPSEAPILSGPECTAQRSYAVEVFAERPSGDEPVGAMAVSADCRASP